MRTETRKLIEEALDYESHAFDDDTDVNGADLVEFFAEWRLRLTSAMKLEV